MVTDPIFDLYERNARVNEFFLNQLSPEDLALSDGKGGMTVAGMLSHMAASRGGWLLEMGMSPQHAAGIKQLAGDANFWEGQTDDPATLRAMFAASDEAALNAVRAHLMSGEPFADPHAAGTFPRNPAYFLHYMMVHDANHRGQIAALLRQHGWNQEKRDHLEEQWDIWRQ